MVAVVEFVLAVGFVLGEVLGLGLGFEEGVEGIDL